MSETRRHSENEIALRHAFDIVKRAGISVQELSLSLRQLSDEVAQFGRACCLSQLREGLTHPCTETEIQALLQIASKGRVHGEDRLRAPRGLADGRLLTLGTALEAIRAHERCSLGALTDLVNAGSERVTTPLAGSICEECYDAPAVRVVSALCGGERGVCGACVEAP